MTPKATLSVTGESMADGPAMFGRPKGIAIDSDGHVYVADAQLNRMQVYSAEGKPLLTFGSEGWDRVSS